MKANDRVAPSQTSVAPAPDFGHPPRGAETNCHEVFEAWVVTHVCAHPVYGVACGYDRGAAISL